MVRSHHVQMQLHGQTTKHSTCSPALYGHIELPDASLLCGLVLTRAQWRRGQSDRSSKVFEIHAAGTRCHLEATTLSLACYRMGLKAVT